MANWIKKKLITIVLRKAEKQRRLLITVLSLGGTIIYNAKIIDGTVVLSMDNPALIFNTEISFSPYQIGFGGLPLIKHRETTAIKVI